MELLLGVPYTWAVISVGVLMLIYAVAGGMLATTWVQIIKAGLLMGGGFLLFLLMAAHFGFNPLRFFSEVVSSPKIQSWVQIALLKQPVAQPGFRIWSEVPGAGSAANKCVGSSISRHRVVLIGCSGHATHPHEVFHGA